MKHALPSSLFTTTLKEFSAVHFSSSASISSPSPSFAHAPTGRQGVNAHGDIWV
jgi:hypothetical protein